MSYQRPYEVPERKNAKDPLYYEMGSSVLKNNLGITDPQKAAEEETIGFIQAQVIFTGKLTKKTKFDEKYIRSIHRTALGHLYPFAGNYRDVDLSKAGHHFLPCVFIPRGMIYLELEFLSKLPSDYEDVKKLIEDIAIVHCELIHIHPFREGNGRTARIFADLMANRAGYPSLELDKFRMNNYPQYIEALNKGDDKDYSAMTEIIGKLFPAS
ncbi:MAG: Fic family protein [Bacteroidetes bacterium]|nr:Fic family protein [Bacteroidota bacterium]